MADNKAPEKIDAAVPSTPSYDIQAKPAEKLDASRFSHGRPSSIGIDYWGRVRRRTTQLGEALHFLKLELDRISSIVTRLEKDVRVLEGGQVKAANQAFLKKGNF